MHGRACKQVFVLVFLLFCFSGPITSTFNATCINEKPLKCCCEKKKKKDTTAQRFQISQFHRSFSNDIMEVKGLKVARTWYVRPSCSLGLRSRCVDQHSLRGGNPVQSVEHWGQWPQQFPAWTSARRNVPGGSDNWISPAAELQRKFAPWM